MEISRFIVKFPVSFPVMSACLKSNAKVISFINLKGGVGKTTCAVNFAATLAARDSVPYGEKSNRAPNVLFIDIDPQSNASLTFLKSWEYEQLRPDAEGEENRTIFSIFHHVTDSFNNDTTPRLDRITLRPPPFQIRVPGGNRAKPDFAIDLLASSLKLLDIQDQLVTYQSPYRCATTILEDSLNGLGDSPNSNRAYTHIIIDCPPSLGLVTQNALAITDHVVVPAFLDNYSHWGLDKIEERLVHLRKRKASCDAQILGIVFSRYNKTAKIMNDSFEGKFRRWLDEHFSDRGGSELIFETKITEADIIRKSEAENSPVISYEPSELDKSQMPAARRQRNEFQPVWESFVDDVLSRVHPTKNPPRTVPGTVWKSPTQSGPASYDSTQGVEDIKI